LLWIARDSGSQRAVGVAVIVEKPKFLMEEVGQILQFIPLH
jgi:hypothetical protein